MSQRTDYAGKLRIREAIEEKVADNQVISFCPRRKLPDVYAVKPDSAARRPADT